VQSEGLENDQEEGESMDAVTQDDEAMMAMMGIAGFGSTKVRMFQMRARRHLKSSPQGKHVDGNQEGAAKVKKVRTWRQYMNRFVIFWIPRASHSLHEHPTVVVDLIGRSPVLPRCYLALTPPS